MADYPSNLPQILQSQSQKEISANAADDEESPASLYARNAVTSAALTWGYLGGRVMVAGVPTLIANGTLALTASSTCYIRKLDSTGAVSFTTSIPTSWPALNGGYTPLYDVTTGAATINNDWKDHRSATLFGAGAVGAGGPPTGAAGGDLTGTYPNPTIGTNKVTLGQMAQLATARLLGRTTAGTGDVEALTVLPTALVPAFTGDVTNSAGSLATTLASTITAAGPIGDGTHVAQITYDAKGRLTTVTSVAITGAAPSGAAGGDLAGTYPNPTVKASVSLTTPNINVATATSVNKVALTAPATSATLTIADGKTLTASNSITLAGTDATTMTFPPASASVGYLNIPQNSQSTAYTTVLADAGKHLLHPAADTTARTFTIDSNANVAFPVGTAITFVNENSAGVMTIAITSDTMRLAGAGTTGSRTLAANGVATAIKITTTSWIISGTGLT